MPRRSWMLAALAVGLCALPAAAQDKKGAVDQKKVDESVAKGLEYLRKNQSSDGSWSSQGGMYPTTMTGMAGLALLLEGSTCREGKYADTIGKAVDWYLKRSQQNGLLGTPSNPSEGSRYTYGHGFGMLFLACVYGEEDDPATRKKLEALLKKAVDFSCKAVTKHGGWGYVSAADMNDFDEGSTTVTQLQALRAARNAGIYVPNETIDRCIDYVKRSQNSDGGFMYQLSGGPSRFPRSAAGIVALYSAGIYEGDEIRKGLDYLMQNMPRAEDFSRDTHAMYGHYYAVQAMWQAGGEHWKKWYPAVQEVLVRQQQPDGSWQDLICSEYGTAMSCIILQMPNNYLPIFQR